MKRILARRGKTQSSFHQEKNELSPNVPEEQNSFGLKILAEGVEPTIDIFAIHGLNGHREKTWTAKNGILWLRDLLPRVIPNARIITYGYDSRTHSTDPLTHQTLYGHATMLVTTMTTFRQTSKVENIPPYPLKHKVSSLFDEYINVVLIVVIE
ncbi:MAG: hypothetical protein Q9214_000672 [Letrouitia sp. 1 TL-2023]